MTSALPIPFRPEEHALPALFDALSNPALSLREVALAHHTTAESLALWISQPDIADRLSATDSSSTWRTRLLAKSLLPKVALCCSQILDRFNAAPKPLAPSQPPVPSSHTPAPATDLTRAAILELRSAESARRAGSLLLQLARLDDTRPPAPRSQPVHAPPALASPPPAAPVDSLHPSPALAAIDSEINALLTQLLSTLPHPEPQSAPASDVDTPEPAHPSGSDPELPALAPTAPDPQVIAGRADPQSFISTPADRRSRDQRHHSRRDSPRALLAATGAPGSRPNEHWP